MSLNRSESNNSDMEVDPKPGFGFNDQDGVMQNLNEANDLVSERFSASSQSVNDEANSEDGEIDITGKGRDLKSLEEQKNHTDARFVKNAQAISAKCPMAFMNYFTCRTQRVQVKSDSEEVGKKKFVEIFKVNSVPRFKLNGLGRSRVEEIFRVTKERK